MENYFKINHESCQTKPYSNIQRGYLIPWQVWQCIGQAIGDSKILSGKVAECNKNATNGSSVPCLKNIIEFKPCFDS